MELKRGSKARDSLFFLGATTLSFKVKRNDDGDDEQNLSGARSEFVWRRAGAAKRNSLARGAPIRAAD